MRSRCSVRRLSAFQLLLLLLVTLHHLLGLLLVPLLHLLLPFGIGLLLRSFLMFLLLALLKLLPLLRLLLIELVLLLLILLVLLRSLLLSLCVVWRSRPRISRGQIFRVHRRVRSVSGLIRRSGHRGFSVGLIRRTIGGWMIGCTGLFSGHYSGTRKRRGLLSRSDRRLAMISLRPQLRIGTGGLYMLRLRRDWRNVPLAGGRFFLSRRPRLDPAVAAVIADASAVYGLVDVGHVNVVNVGDVDVVDRAVVVKLPIIPAPALVTVAKVAIAIRDPAVETNRRAPVSLMKKVNVIGPSPVRRRPQQSRLRR